MIEYVHHVRGRLRVKCFAIRRNPVEARRLQALLLGVEGIDAAEANDVTGSVVVRYDPACIGHDAVLGEIARLCAPLALATRQSYTDAQRPPSVDRLAGTAGRAVAGFLIEKLIERSAVALVAAIV